MSNKIKSAAIAAAVGLSLSLAAVHADAAKAKMEKCYGIAKTGMNGCGTKKHACAGQSIKDSDSTEWMYVAKGNCKKIVKCKK